MEITWRRSSYWRVVAFPLAISPKEKLAESFRDTHVCYRCRPDFGSCSCGYPARICCNLGWARKAQPRVARTDWNRVWNWRARHGPDAGSRIPDYRYRSAYHRCSYDPAALFWIVSGRPPSIANRGASNTAICPFEVRVDPPIDTWRFIDHDTLRHEC